MFESIVQHKQREKSCNSFYLTESESPDVICPANQTEFTEPGQSNATVSWEAPAVNSDDEEAAKEAAIDVDTCHPRPGWNFKIGQTKVVCEAKNVDQREENMCHFYVNVVGKSAATQSICALLCPRHTLPDRPYVQETNIIRQCSFRQIHSC